MPRQPRAPEGQDHERLEVAVLAERLGGVPSDPLLLDRALAHRSWCAEVTVGEPEQSNERLEFLGDAVLGLVVTDHLYRSYPELSEGQLAKTRASVVDAGTLAEVAAELGIGAGLRLGKGEDASGGRQKASILADTMEAVIGAVYLDGGWEAASKLVLGLLGNRLADAAEGPGGQDYKTRLQELAAGAFDQLPSYEVTSEGPDHAKRFFATVHVGGSARGQGEGRSKKRAEQVAARAAWEELALLRGEQVPESRA
ncbi:MAG: ribonuclease III [Actinomycetota bacterium]|nr:ribonuclease III [Actinomycetota bacterium]MDQ3574603.1 ribonuclease III [Actinomycetota bacterium]